MDTLEQLLEQNKTWAKSTNYEKPGYFKELAKGQKPEILWIGCADSRVPPSVITGADPGMLFMHRNIANLAVHTDAAFHAVLEYAVDVLKVKHVVVAGHYNCGGVHAACSAEPAPDSIDHWIQHIRDIRRMYEKELMEEKDPVKREDRLVDLNVTEQVRNIKTSSTIKKARKRGQQVALHGLVYDTGTGLLKRVV
ncbi:MAG: carbonic anhydrase [Balneolaceae bacterium]|nr:MAG: carbonic anhydrase [Balneolaceae bacterium]